MARNLTSLTNWKQNHSDMYHTIFNQLSEPRIILKADAPVFTVVAFNPAYQLATRNLAENTIGESFWNTFDKSTGSANSLAQLRAALEQAIKTGSPERLPPYRFDLTGPDGLTQQHWWEVEVSPFRVQGHDMHFILCTTWNISERVASNKARERHDRVQNMLLGMQEKISEDLEIATEQVTSISEAKAKLELTTEKLRRANHDLQQAQQLLEKALSTADMGTWSIDMKTGILQLSARIRQMFGFPLEGPVSVDAAMEAIDPLYRDYVQKVLNEGLVTHTDIIMEYPLNNFQSGERFWVRATGGLFLGSNNTPLHYSGVFIDITRQKQDEERMNAFIAIVSHELKTPLTSVKAYLQLLERNAASVSATQDQYLIAKTIAQTNRMDRLIDAYLHSSKLEAGRITLEYSSFSLNELIDEIIREQKLINHFPNVSFNHCEVKPIVADKEKIGQVISNMIGNAMKYSPGGQPVSITCGYDNEMAIIKIKDNGIGISPADQPHIFKRFYRADNIPVHRAGSFGVGLYLCAEIIHQHNGDIYVESEPDKGSVFVMTIPVSPEPTGDPREQLNSN
jgi:PAS domain S-box-containing protein